MQLNYASYTSIHDPSMYNKGRSYSTKKSKMNTEVPLSKNIDNTIKKHNSKNQVIESVKKILRTSNQLSDDLASIRMQPSIDIGGTSNGRGKGNNGIRFGYGYGSGRL